MSTTKTTKTTKTMKKTPAIMKTDDLTLFNAELSRMSRCVKQARVDNSFQVVDMTAKALASTELSDAVAEDLLDAIRAVCGLRRLGGLIDELMNGFTDDLVPLNLN